MKLKLSSIKPSVVFIGGDNDSVQRGFGDDVILTESKKVIGHDAVARIPNTVVINTKKRPFLFQTQIVPICCTSCDGPEFAPLKQLFESETNKKPTPMSQYKPPLGCPLPPAPMLPYRYGIMDNDPTPERRAPKAASMKQTLIKKKASTAKFEVSTRFLAGNRSKYRLTFDEQLFVEAASALATGDSSIVEDCNISKSTFRFEMTESNGLKASMTHSTIQPRALAPPPFVLLRNSGKAC